MKIFGGLERHNFYWRSRLYLLTQWFYLKRFFYYRLQDAYNLQYHINIARSLMGQVISSIVISVGVIVFCEGLDSYLHNFNTYVSLFPKYGKLSGEFQLPYDTLLGTVAGVSGVFIALYFTTISVVASQMSSKFTTNLTDLLFREKVGNHYIYILSLNTSMSLLLLGYRAASREPGILIVIVISFLSCYSVFCFTLLGRRAFHFFDPAELAKTLYDDLAESTRSATKSGYAWTNPGFQESYRKQASKAVQTLGNLVQVCNSLDNLPKQSLSEVLQRSILSVISYQETKKTIPSDSNWYEKISRYQNWFFTSETEVSIALNTATGITPRLESNHYWLEHQIYYFTFAALEQMLSRKDFKEAYGVLQALTSLIETLGKNLDTQEAIKILSRLDKIIDEKLLNNLDPVPNALLQDNLLPALLEIYNRMLIALLLGVVKPYLDLKNSYNIEYCRIEDLLQGGGNQSSPFLMAERMEFVIRRLSFEKSVEGREVSPQWYVNQLIISRYGELLCESLRGLVTVYQEFYINNANKLYQKKEYSLAAMVLHLGLEWRKKADVHFSVVEEYTEKLDVHHIKKDLYWPSWDWGNWNSQLKETSAKIHGKLSECLIFLAIPLPQKGKMPDIFGQTYHTLCVELYYYLLNNEDEDISKVFSALFIAGFKAFEELHKETKDWTDANSSMMFATEPIADIMKLSGYAKIYSELHGNPSLWNSIEKVWDEYFQRTDSQLEPCKLIVGIQELRYSSLNITSHASIYTHWELELNKSLYGKGLLCDRYSSVFDSQHKVKHNSSLIRALCFSESEVHDDAADVFIITYVSQKKCFKEIQYRDQWGLVQRINKEIGATDDNSGKEV